MSVSSTVNGFGRVIGYVLSYFIFTTILFYALQLLGKFPITWTYLHIMVIVAGVSLAAMICAKVVK